MFIIKCKRIIRWKRTNSKRRRTKWKWNRAHQEIVNPPTIREVKDCIDKLKNNKAPGEDEIVAELIKYGGQTITKMIFKLITEIWIIERMPESWTTGVICPICKKGDKTDWGITLLHTTYKILTAIIQERIKVYSEKLIGEYQCAFRSNRSTIDQIFVMRQLIEKHFEHDLDLYIAICRLQTSIWQYKQNNAVGDNEQNGNTR